MSRDDLVALCSGLELVHATVNPDFGRDAVALTIGGETFLFAPDHAADLALKIIGAAARLRLQQEQSK